MRIITKLGLLLAVVLQSALTFAAPVQAQQAPKGVVLQVAPGATAAGATITLNGVPIGSLSTSNGTFTPVGVSSATTVPNAAALLAYTGSANHVRRNGFYKAGDGGAAEYDLNPTATCSAMDLGSCEPAANGGSWVLDPVAAGVSLKVFGAKCDSLGVAGFGTDDTLAVQAAFNWSNATSHKVLIPSDNRLMCRVVAPLTSAHHLILFGDGAEPYEGSNVLGNARGGGSWLFFDHPGKGIILNGQLGGIASTGSILQDFGTARAQPAPPAGSDGAGYGASWAPGNFDFDIVQNIDESTIRNVLTLNPTRQLLINAGRANVEYLRGQPLLVGIQVVYAADTIRLLHTHEWPLWANNSAVNAYTSANYEALKLSRIDDGIIDDFYTFAPLNCIHFYQAVAGDPGSVPIGLHMRDLVCDGVGQYALWFDNVKGFRVTATGLGMGSARPMPRPTQGVYIDPNSSGFLTLAQTESSDFSGPVFNIQGGGNLSLNDLYIPTWNASVQGQATPAAPIFCAGPQASITVSGHIVNGGPGNGGGFVGCTAANTLMPVHVNAGTGLVEPEGVALSGFDASGTYGAIPQGASFGLPTGLGGFWVVDTANNNVVDFVAGGGGVSMTGATGSTFIVQNPGVPTASIPAYVPSGKIAIYYDSTTGLYSLYNNTGAAVVIRYGRMTLNPGSN